VKKFISQLFGEGLFGTGWKNAALSIGLLVAVFLTSQVYNFLDHGPAVLNLRTPLDVILPVVPIFVIPYDSLMPVIVFTLVVFLLTRTRLFQSFCLALIVAWFVSYGFYFFLQTEVLRPVLTDSDLLTRMIRDIYTNDNPFNDFPSLHASLSVIAAIHWFRVDRRLGLVVAVWTALIATSTVLIKQHYVVGVVSGLVLAAGASWLSMRILYRKPAKAS
jgi:membrane-associated phospholipid phosphatase